MGESYADAPVSISEARSDRDGKASTWTPRDALVSMLREIDSGKINPENIFVSYSWTSDDDKLMLRRVIAGPAKTYEWVGVLSYEIFRLNSGP